MSEWNMKEQLQAYSGLNSPSRIPIRIRIAGELEQLKKRQEQLQEVLELLERNPDFERLQDLI